MAQVLPSPGVKSHSFHQITKDKDVSSFNLGPSTVPPLLYHHHHQQQQLPTSSFVTSNTSDTLDLIDIRSSSTSLLDTLDTKTLSFLLQPPGHKSLPSLLLWDEKGQSLYDSILATPHYYPYRVENALLQKQISQIASTIASSTTDVLVELGAGNLSKTALLLTALDRCLDSSTGKGRGKIVYYALDVDHSLLSSSLAQLRKRTSSLKHIELRALLGTYEDGARWLSQSDLAPYRKTMVWLGNSIANYEKEEASALLSKFTSQNGMQSLAGFLLGVDGCLDPNKVERAYNAPGGENGRWVLHALEAAREQLGLEEGSCEMFDESNWRFEGRWDAEERRYENYLVPLKKMEAAVYSKEEKKKKKVVLEEGEKVFVLGSGKWTARDVQRICEEGPGLRLRRSWHSEEADYGVYWLQPEKKRLDSGIDMDEDEER